MWGRGGHMQEPPILANESSRISSLVKLDVLDSEPEERFDCITRLAKKMFDVPIALISLVDTERQWFKSKQGLEASETCRKSSFCAHAITMPSTTDPSHRILEVPDTLKDQRFHDNPLVVGDPHIRFYAGFVLQSHEDYNLGTLCIIDSEPRELSEQDKKALFDFGMIAQNSLQSLRYEDKDLHTGLYNRRGFFSVVDYALDSCVRQKLYCTIVYIKISGYEQILEQYGGLVEREILSDFVSCLKSTFRKSDVVARIGEDTFAVLTLHSMSFGVEAVLIHLKQKIQNSNSGKKIEFHTNYQVGSFKFDPEFVNSSGKLIDLIDKRIVESDYLESCSLQTYSCS